MVQLQGFWNKVDLIPQEGKLAIMKTPIISVLIIDDCQEDRDVFSRFLHTNTQQTFRILEANTGGEGLELCRSEQPDCILLDYQLPDINGLEFIESLGQEHLASPIPVLMLTGQGNETLAVDALKNGAVDYIVKRKMTAEGLYRAISRAVKDAVRLQFTLKQRKEIERSQLELQQFAYTASHDLQAPVRRVITFLQLLEKDRNSQLSERAQEYLQRALNSAKHMRLFMTDLLEYAVVGKAEQSYKPVDLQQVFDEVLVELGDTIQEVQSTIQSDPLPTVHGNPTFLHQLFQNLLSNALKFRSEQPLTIHISVSHLDTHWLFMVKDNGIGIAPTDIEKVFGIFQRLDTTSKVEGTGIGLAICKKVVELHDGKIWIESSQHQGTTFNFTIPIIDSVIPKEEEDSTNKIYSSLTEFLGKPIGVGEHCERG